MAKTNAEYQKDYPHRMYIYFTSFSEEVGAPSFAKFARSIGATSDDVEAFRVHKEFERAYKECREIRRDYLIDNALSKRFDSSLVKFLISEYEAERDAGGEELALTLRVVGDAGNGA